MKQNPRWLLVVLLALAAGASPDLRAQNPIPTSPRSLLSRDPATANNAPAPFSAATSQAAPPTPSGPLAAAPTTTTVTVGADYVLAPSDSIEMSVFHEPDLTTQTRIASDGSAQFPLIGEVKVAGMVLRDAREMIRHRYNADYLVEPQVYLNVIGYAQRKFTILGQVAKPGSYDFPSGEHLTLLEAVGIAGGFTRLADQSGVSIQRSGPGGDKTLKVNAKKLAAKGSKPFQVVSGDVVTVGESWF